MTFNELEHLIREKGFIVDLHEVSGFSVWDYMGRKIIYPLGKKISRSGIRVSDLVNKTRRGVDSLPYNKFRTNAVILGTQQLLVAHKE